MVLKHSDEGEKISIEILIRKAPENLAKNHLVAPAIIPTHPVITIPQQW
jgi:hypothetical protein